MGNGEVNNNINFGQVQKYGLQNLNPNNLTSEVPVSIHELSEGSPARYIAENALSEDNNEEINFTQERKDKYGVLFSDLTSQERNKIMKYGVIENSRMVLSEQNSGNFPKEISKGVFQTEKGGYTITNITLYDGKSYDQLTPEEQAKVDKYESDLKAAEAKFEEEHPFNPMMCDIGYPERYRKEKEEYIRNNVKTPYEITNETRVKKSSDENKNKADSSSFFKDVFSDISNFFKNIFG